jgi:antitoxin MazE
MAMQVSVKKWGNSASVRIPAAILQAARLQLDDMVDIRDEEGRIVIEPLRPEAYDLDQLLAGITRTTSMAKSISAWASAKKHSDGGRYVPEAALGIGSGGGHGGGHGAAGHAIAACAQSRCYGASPILRRYSSTSPCHSSGRPSM